MAAWIEALVGIVYVVGTGGSGMPVGNRIVVEMSPQARERPHEFLETLAAVYASLEAIGVPMPSGARARAEQVLQ